MFRIALMFALGALLSTNLPSQTTPTAPPAVKRDPQALALLNQVVSVAGGVTTIAAINDYMATGNVTYHWSEDVQGGVTIRALGLDEFRMDATLPNGPYFEGIDSTGTAFTKWEEGSISYSRGPIPMMAGSMALPSLRLAAVVDDLRFAISYEGVARVDGRNAYQIHAQRGLPGANGGNGLDADYQTLDAFVDASTNQIIMTQDVLSHHVARKIHYANYEVVSGVSVPFSINEEIGAQNTFSLQLTGITFNVGLQESVFTF